MNCMTNNALLNPINPVTVGELIEELSKHEPSAEIIIMNPSWSYFRVIDTSNPVTAGDGRIAINIKTQSGEKQ